MKAVTLAIFTILILGFGFPKKETVFIGTVTTDTKSANDIVGLIIEFRIDTLVIAKNVIQQDGSFKILAPTDKEFDIYYRGIGIDDTYVQTIKPTNQDTVFLTFQIPKIYKKRFGKTVCPKCNKHNQTIPIQYGWGSAIIVQNLNSKGDTIYTHYDKKNYYSGTCITSDFDPQYFCKRDNIKF